MSLTSYVGLLAGAATLSIAGAGWSEMNTSEDAMANRIAALESEIQTLKASQGDQWLTEQRASEIRGLVQDVLADADTRASLLQSGMTAGWDKGFFLSSSDGNYKLHVGGWLQTRFVYNTQDKTTGTGLDDDDRYGFENTRTRLIFDGHVVNPSWKYKISGDFGRGGDGGSDLDLKDAYITHVCNENFDVTVGQFKDPFLRETLVSSFAQLAVDRSIVNAAFGTGRVQGIMGGWHSDNFRASAAFSDGARSEDTPWETEDTEIGAMSGRVEWMASGSDWSQFDDFTSWQGESMGILVGGAFRYQNSEFGTTTGPEIQTWAGTLDVSVEGGGWNLYGAFIYQNSDDDAAINAQNWGFLVQGGIFLAPEWEIFGRFEWIDVDLAGSNEFTVLTAGVNKYFAKNKVKWTTDFGVAFDEVLAVTTGTTTAELQSVGWRTDETDADSQWVIRSQLQLGF